MFPKLTLPLAFSLVASTYALAVEKLPSLTFELQDWGLRCDNTRTCRADGYQTDEAEYTRAVSVLLERRAGPGNRCLAL